MPRKYASKRRHAKSSTSGSDSSSTVEEKTVITRVVETKRHRESSSCSDSDSGRDRKHHKKGKPHHKGGEHKKKAHKPHRKDSSSSDSDDKGRRRRKGSCSSSDSDEKGRKPRKDSCSSEEKPHCSGSSDDKSGEHKKCRESWSSCSDSGEWSSCDEESWCDDDGWESKVCEIKARLLCDPSLMAAGSDAFGSFFGVAEQTVDLAAPVKFDLTQAAYNIDADASRNAVWIRKSGVYFILFSVAPDQASQWTLFVNDQPHETKGVSSGAGQMIMYKLFELQENDNVSIRNFSSGIGTVVIPPTQGGSILGTNTELVITKIAPTALLQVLNKPRRFCLSRKSVKKFRKLKRALLCDPAFMIEGSDAYGAFWSTMPQNVAVEAPVVFTDHGPLMCEEHIPGTGAITIKKSGVYLFTFLTETITASQFTIAINGVPNLTTTGGTNKGGSAVFLRQTLELKEGDVVTVINHVSTAGAVDITASPGGLAVGANASFVMYKIAPPLCKLAKPVPLGCWCNREANEKENCAEQKATCAKCKPLKACDFYEKFKQYLLRQRCLSIAGSAAYVHAANTVQQTIPNEMPVPMGINGPLKRACHTPGLPEFRVARRGVYYAMFDAETLQPAQFAVFNDNSAFPSTISGTNGGANEVSIAQLIPACREDKLTVRNHTSYASPVQTQVNPGGIEVAENTSFTLLRIGNMPPCKKECKDEKPCKKSK